MNYASEAGRWYLPDGSPFMEVENKSKPGEFRPATVRDALKVNAEPSVTSVLKAAAAPQLTNWLIQQALDAALTLPRLEGESLDAFKERALRDSQEQSRKARDEGTEIHAAIEQACRGEAYNTSLHGHVLNVMVALKTVGIDLMTGKPERSFCLAGYFGGKIDWSSDEAVIDFKGIDDAKLDGRLGYDDHVRQLAAYNQGLGAPITRRLINVFVGRQSGRVKIKEWKPEEAAHAFQEFMALLRFYRLTKGLPVKDWKEAADGN